eukprot:gene27015-59610_t
MPRTTQEKDVWSVGQQLMVLMGQSMVETRLMVKMSAMVEPSVMVETRRSFVGPPPWRGCGMPNAKLSRTAIRAVLRRCEHNPASDCYSTAHWISLATIGAKLGVKHYGGKANQYGKDLPGFYGLELVPAAEGAGAAAPPPAAAAAAAPTKDDAAAAVGVEEGVVAADGAAGTGVSHD